MDSKSPARDRFGRFVGPTGSCRERTPEEVKQRQEQRAAIKAKVAEFRAFHKRHGIPLDKRPTLRTMRRMARSELRHTALHKASMTHYMQ